jgi:hypothetical protein
MNNESAIFHGLSDLIKSKALEPIANYLQSRQQQGPVTVEELVKVLQLPANSTPTQSAAPQAGAPSGFPAMNGMPPAITGFGGMPMQMSGGNSSKGRAKSPAEVPPDNERCQYTITRGANKGLRCSKRCETGIPYCKQHKTTKVAKEHLERLNGGAPQSGGAQPGVPSQGMPGGLPGMSGMNPAMFNSQQSAQPKKPQMNAVQIGPGFYREVTHNLALKTGKPGEFICCGFFPDPNNTNNIQPLTKEVMDFCQQNQLGYVDPEKTEGNAQSTSDSSNQPQGLPSFQQQGLPNMNSSPSQSQQSLPQQGLPNINHSPDQSQQGLPQQGLPQQGLPNMNPSPGQSQQEQQGIPQQGLPNMNSNSSQQQGLPQQGLPNMNSNSSQQQGVPQQGLPNMNPSPGQSQQSLPKVPTINDSASLPSVTDTNSPDDPVDGDDE